jgi:hypothetical protein
MSAISAENINLPPEPFHDDDPHKNAPRRKHLRASGSDIPAIDVDKVVVKLYSKAWLQDNAKVCAMLAEWARKEIQDKILKEDPMPSSATQKLLAEQAYNALVAANYGMTPETSK